MIDRAIEFFNNFNNLITLLTIIPFIWLFIKFLLGKLKGRTSTDIDDRALAAMEEFERKVEEAKNSQFVTENAPRFFEAVEKLAKINALNGFGKLCAFLDMANKAYKATHGQELTEEQKKALEQKAAELAAAQKQK